MARVYAYCEGAGPRPSELELLWSIERFGVEAVMGRAYLERVEIEGMTLAESVHRAFKSRAGTDFGEWVEKHPSEAALLDAAWAALHEDTEYEQ